MDSLINLLIAIFTMGLVVVLIAFAFILGIAMTVADGFKAVFGRRGKSKGETDSKNGD